MSGPELRNDMNPINLDKLVARVRQLAADYPEAVYSKGGNEFCCYLSGQANGVPHHGCIVGVAMQLEGMINEEFTGGIVALLEQRTTCDSESSEATWLSYVQNEQDSGCSWATAVVNADDWAKL
jgi:hypothetical protein